MLIISFHSILNSIDRSLEKNVKSYDNSRLDNFIDVLRKFLSLSEAIEKLNKIPKDTLFTIDRYEGDYAVCENRVNGKMFDIPKSKIASNLPEGTIVKLEDGVYTPINQ